MKNCLLKIIFVYLLSVNHLTAQKYAHPVPGSEGLTGSFGEMRPNHFHFGLDIRVFSKWGIPILAAADGYVSRIRTFYNGYGKALYITHADGQVTCYGHLENYVEKIEERMYKDQFAKKQFNRDLSFYPHEYPVKKGDVIGYSGSTGGSSGPHLHFEVRDPQERILNPMEWYRDFFPDKIPPILSRIAFEPLETSSRVNGVFDKLILYPQNSQYLQPVQLTGKVGFQFTGYDRLYGAPNYNGIYRAVLELDEKTIFEIKFDRFHFDDSRYILVHQDYEYFQEFDGWLQKCYLDKGNKAPVYPNMINKGVIELKDDDIHILKLTLYDYHQNRTNYSCKIKKASDSPVNFSAVSVGKNTFTHTVKKNVLIFKQLKNSNVRVYYSDGSSTDYSASYYKGGHFYILVNMRLPKIPQKAVNSEGQEILFNFTSVLVPGKDVSFVHKEKFRAFFTSGAVFDTTFLQFKEITPNHVNACSPIYYLGPVSIPLMESMVLRIFPDRNTERFKPEQMVLLEIKPNGTTNRFAVNATGATVARRFGKFCLIGDDRPPVIKSTNFVNGQTVNKKKKLTFYVNDDIAEVNPFNVQATLDGQWCLVEYYEYTHSVFYYLRPDILPGLHTLELKVTDYAGNTAVKTFTFKVAE